MDYKMLATKGIDEANLPRNFLDYLREMGRGRPVSVRPSYSFVHHIDPIATKAVEASQINVGKNYIGRLIRRCDANWTPIPNEEITLSFDGRIPGYINDVTGNDRVALSYSETHYLSVPMPLTTLSLLLEIPISESREPPKEHWFKHRLDNHRKIPFP